MFLFQALLRKIQWYLAKERIRPLMYYRSDLSLRLPSCLPSRLPSYTLWRMCSLLSASVMASILLVACSGLNFGASPSSSRTTKSTFIMNTPTIQVTLASLHWCGKSVLVFRDEGAATNNTPTAGTPTAGSSPTVTSTAVPKTINDWSQVEPNLGFTVYLPGTLPTGSCLISASGTIHDPTFGGIFTIGYLLPNHDSISFSEAPLLSQSQTFQCSPSTADTKTGSGTPTPAATPIQLCTGAREKTSVVLSARGTPNSLQQIFSALQPHVAWVPST